VNDQDFDHGEGPGVMYPVVWLLVTVAAVASAVIVVRFLQ
jgi:hypothetical protein